MHFNTRVISEGHFEQFTSSDALNGRKRVFVSVILQNIDIPTLIKIVDSTIIPVL